MTALPMGMRPFRSRIRGCYLWKHRELGMQTAEEQYVKTAGEERKVLCDQPRYLPQSTLRNCGQSDDFIPLALIVDLCHRADGKGLLEFWDEGSLLFWCP